MARVTFTAKALQDINEHTEYRSDYSDRAAIRFSVGLIAAIDQLREYPESGRSREDLRKQLRALAIKKLRLTVFYAFDKKKDTVIIARVLRHERDIAAAFETVE